jgi:LRR receptor-like serine/threonine-protein kinase FLS2
MERIRLIFSLFVALLTVQFHLASLVVATSRNTTTDQYALLALKAQISYDPHSVLTHNWSTNTSVCNWIGITCGFPSSSSHRIESFLYESCRHHSSTRGKSFISC